MNDKVVQPDSNSPSSKSILEFSFTDARTFFLEAESYCSVDLPPYFTFDKLLQDIHSVLDKKELSDFKSKKKLPTNYDDVNYTILTSKDGKYAWRPLQLIHPALYVSLVHNITKEENWSFIIERFKVFSENKKIKCLSIPVVSQSDEKDKAEQILYWWREIEQASIGLALEYDHLLETDITDCYGAIYTHSIAWALHTKEKAKKKRDKNTLIGNQIDKHIRDMRHGQTNGIPQGSVLMDFIAEIVLGYVDIELSKKIEDARIADYLILRYRDDYRIFINNPRDGEQIVKLLTEATIPLGLKLNPSKTKASDDVIRASIKADKIAWLSRKQSERILQKHLLIIHDHALQFPGAGSLAVALHDYYNRLSEIKTPIRNPLPLISIVVDIAYKNPRFYPICAAILSKLMRFVDECDQSNIFEKIQKKFAKLPNTGYMQICLQRISYPIDKHLKYDEHLCKLIEDKNFKQIWNMDWISSEELKNASNVQKIIDREELKRTPPVVPPEEAGLFKSKAGYNLGY